MASAPRSGSEPPNPSVKPQYPPAPGLTFPPNAQPAQYQIRAPMVPSKADQSPYYANQGYGQLPQPNAMVRPPSVNPSSAPPAPNQPLLRPPAASSPAMAGQLNQSAYGSVQQQAPLNRPVGVAGPFAKAQVPNQGFVAPIPGSTQFNQPHLGSGLVPGPATARQVVPPMANPTPFPPQVGSKSFATTPPTVTPPTGPPSNPASQGPTPMRPNQMQFPAQIPNQNYVAPPIGLPRGPPSFGSSIASAQAPTQVVPSYAPTPIAPAPSFGVHASQYPPYGGPPSMSLDGKPSQGPPFQSPYQGMQTLAEEFQSLSMNTAAPGSMESIIDPNTLPRPSGRAEHPPTSMTSNCHSRYFRLTSGSLPNSQSVSARWHLPLGAVVHPLAEAPLNEEVPVVDFGAAGIVRCRRCRTYINPYVIFTDNGRRWRCNLCSLNNEVPSEYYCPLDQNGRRTDANERPELCQGSVELIAPAEYMVRPPMPPVYFFLIDVSESATKTGMLQIAVDTIKSCLDKLPGYPRTQIGFLTFDSTLHFYSLKSSLTQPQMMVVTDLDDPFLPMPDDLLVNLSESRTVVESLLTSLPSMFKDNANVESAAGPALRAVFMLMSQLGGKLFLFQSTLPSLGVGRLKLRGDDPRLYGSDKEASVRNSEDPFYKQMAADFSKFQISVSLYAFGNNYIDLASLGTLAKYTAGQVYFYPLFQSHLNGEKFSYELARDLTRETAWEAVLRIRCGKGMRFNTYHGHFLLRSSDLMALPAVDCDKAFAMQMILEESLLTMQTAYLQAALLYTSSNGERRIRIHTLAAPLTSDLNEMYRSADVGAITTLLSRIALERSLTMKLDDVRQQFVQSKLVLALREYQNIFGVQHALTGRLIYPESLKLLPLYCLSLSKCLALRTGNTGATLDERIYASFEMMVMSVPRLLNFLYPLMFRLDECLLKGGGDIKSIQPLRLSVEKLDSQGAFIVDDGLRLIVWFGSVLQPTFLVQLLGTEAVKTADLSKAVVAEQNNDLSKTFISLLKSLRASAPAVYQQCILVRQGDQPREGFLVLFNLVEDRLAGSIGYAEWMVQIYRQVKQKA